MTGKKGIKNREAVIHYLAMLDRLADIADSDDEGLILASERYGATKMFKLLTSQGAYIDLEAAVRAALRGEDDEY